MTESTSSTISHKSHRTQFFSPAPPSKPLVGLYVCNTALDDSFPKTSPYLTTDYDWSSPIIDGVVERISWAGLETSRGMSGFGIYSFVKLDTECQRAIENGKLITLDIFGGINAPKWLVRSPYTLGTDYKVFWIDDNGGMGCDTFPLVWSKSYISNFDTFIRKLSLHLSTIVFHYGGGNHKLKEAIGMVKIGTCCTIYTSELRVPNEFCSSGGCCTSTDSEKWVGQSKYTVSILEASINYMADAVADTFKGKIRAVPIVSGGEGFPSPQLPTACPPLAGYIDCITPTIIQDLVTHVNDTNQVMAMYESLNTGSNDGSVCKELTYGTTSTNGVIATSHCLLGYQLDASVYGGRVSDSVNCMNLGTALDNGLMLGARYFEVFEHDFKTLGCYSTTSFFYLHELH